MKSLRNAGRRGREAARARTRPTRPLLEGLEVRLVLATITVTSTGDAIAVDGVVTLREAITAANTNAVSGDAPAGTAGLDDIAFNIPGTGLQTITPTTALPSITEPIVIDGLTQPGSSANTLAVGDDAVLNIEISGANIALNFAGLRIDAGAAGSTIRGLVINRFTAVGSAAVQVFNSSDNTIVGNFLGTDAAGATAMGNNVGVLIRGENNRVGSPSPADRNVISGNGTGISVTNTGTVANTVQGNYIGVNASGDGDLGNTNIGVNISGVFNGATQGPLLIGGTTSAPGSESGNVISGNDGLAGVFFDNAADTVLGPVTIQGNIIGLGADGSTVVGNAGPGIQAETNLNSTNGLVQIGGADASRRNVISGNAGGIVYSDAAAVVQGNYIGTDATGTQDRGNTAFGIEIVGDHRDANDPAATTMTIGGTQPGEGNLISGNDLGGVSVRNANVVIQGNRIGTQADGASPLGNGGQGVRVFNVIAQPLLLVTVGGQVDGAGNVIAFNNIGVDASSFAVVILRNSLFGNGNNGIELTAAALTNAPSSPVLSTVTATTITGAVGGPANEGRRLEFFATPNEQNEGKTFLGFLDVVLDAGGNASFSFNPAGGVPAGQSLTATATAALGTSEFSQAVVLPEAGAVDLGVTMAALPNPVPAGQDATFTIVVANNGPASGLDVALSNAIPADSTFVSFAAPSGWTTSTPAVGGTGTVTANIDSMAVGSATFTLIVRVNPAAAVGTTITNTAAASATNEADPSNNSATAAVTVSAPIPPAEGVADLAVTKTVSTGPLIAGKDFTYTIVALNNGPDPATGVVVADALPAGLTFVSSSLGAYDAASRIVTAQLGDLAVGGAGRTLTITVRADAVGTFTNVAQINGAQTDPDPGNNTASRTDSVQAPPPVESGPRVVSVRREGFHQAPTSIVVAFSNDMDPAQAQNLANYQILVSGRGLAIRSAVYDATSRSVTIRPARRINIHHPFLFVINGRSPDGLRDDDGVLLDGEANGGSGTDYRANIAWYGEGTRVTPVHPSPTAGRKHPRAVLRATRPSRPAPRFALAGRFPTRPSTH